MILAGLLATAFPIEAQTARSGEERSSLSVDGFYAGAPLAAVRVRVMELGGTPLSCRRARADSTVVDCRGRLPAHGGFPVLHVWLSAMGGQTGILTLAGRFETAGITRLQLALAGKYGNVPVSTQGSQRMMQWVRRGRMIRLTWRTDASGASASLSMVDGRILDNWGRQGNVSGTGVAGDSAAR